MLNVKAIPKAIPTTSQRPLMRVELELWSFTTHKYFVHMIERLRLPV